MVPTKHLSLPLNSGQPQRVFLGRSGACYLAYGSKEWVLIGGVNNGVQDVWFNKMFSEAAQTCWNENLAGTSPFSLWHGA